jgi:hypothetical protein
LFRDGNYHQWRNFNSIKWCASNKSLTKIIFF